jgi:hypothetical protein
VRFAAASLRRICAVGNATEDRAVGTTYKLQSCPECLKDFGCVLRLLADCVYVIWSVGNQEKRIRTIVNCSHLG